MRVLNVAETPTVLAVAIHDIGEYVRHSPRGKKYVGLCVHMLFLTLL